MVMLYMCLLLWFIIYVLCCMCYFQICFVYCVFYAPCEVNQIFFSGCAYKNIQTRAWRVLIWGGKITTFDKSCKNNFQKNTRMICNFWRFQRLKGFKLLSSHVAFLYRKKPTKNRKNTRTCTSLYIWWLHQLVQLSTGTI
jgi:hypothetical protein